MGGGRAGGLQDSEPPMQQSPGGPRAIFASLLPMPSHVWLWRSQPLGAPCGRLLYGTLCRESGRPDVRRPDVRSGGRSSTNPKMGAQGRILTRHRSSDCEVVVGADFVFGAFRSLEHVRSVLDPVHAGQGKNGASSNSASVYAKDVPYGSFLQVWRKLSHKH